jgi:hypothetical protein
MLRILGDIRREVNWQLKRLLPFSPRIPARIERDLLALAETFESGQQERFQSLASTYELKTWPLGGEDKEIQWNLSVLDVLDQHVDPSSGPPGSLDVGSRHWGYLPALVSFRPGPWLGVEVDGNQRYLNGNTRAQVARAHAERVDGATYRVGCVRHRRADALLWSTPTTLSTRGAARARVVPGGGGWRPDGDQPGRGGGASTGGVVPPCLDPVQISGPFTERLARL